jgi:hypothetical protein
MWVSWSTLFLWPLIFIFLHGYHSIYSAAHLQMFVCWLHSVGSFYYLFLVSNFLSCSEMSIWAYAWVIFRHMLYGVNPCHSPFFPLYFLFPRRSLFSQMKDNDFLPWLIGLLLENVSSFCLTDVFLNGKWEHWTTENHVGINNLDGCIRLWLNLVLDVII